MGERDFPVPLSRVNRRLQEHGFATALAFAGIFTRAAVVAGLAAALAFTTVLAFAAMFAGVAAGRVGARGVGAGVLRLGNDAGQQPGDGRGDEECSLCSVHNVLSFGFSFHDRFSSAATVLRE